MRMIGVLAFIIISLALFTGCATLGELTAEPSARRTTEREELEARISSLQEENARLGHDLENMRLRAENYRSREAALTGELRQSRAREKEFADRAAMAEERLGGVEERLAEAEQRLSGIVLSARRSREELKKIGEDISSGLRGLGLFSVEEKDGEVAVSFPTVLAFTSEGVGIVGGGEPVLRALAGILNNYPDHEIVVRGHTDDVPISRVYASNWELSAARALAVREFLEESGVDPMRISIAGYGKYRPVASNATAEGRRKNRRVEVAILGREN